MIHMYTCLHFHQLIRKQICYVHNKYIRTHKIPRYTPKNKKNKHKYIYIYIDICMYAMPGRAPGVVFQSPQSCHPTFADGSRLQILSLLMLLLVLFVLLLRLQKLSLNDIIVGTSRVITTTTNTIIVDIIVGIIRIITYYHC